MPDFVTLCNEDDLAIGTPKSFVVDQIPIAVFRMDNGIFALDDRCPHAGASLARGYLEDDVIRCRIHHWGFDIRSGQNVEQRNACRDARLVEVRILDRQVQVRLPQGMT